MNKLRELLNNRNTIFNKAIFLFIAMIFASFIITGFLLSGFMVDYFVNENVKQMAQTASLINTVIDNEISKINTEDLSKISIDRAYIQSIANTCGYMSGSHIYIIENSRDNAGRVIVSYPKIETDIIGNNLLYGNNFYYFDKSQYESALSSDEVIIDKGDYHGLYKGTGTNWVTVAQKLETVNAVDSNGNPIVSGVIVISRQMANVNLTRNTVIRYFLLAMCIAVLLSMFIATFFTKRITEPIEKLKLAANKVSKGDFSEKIEYDTNDDMGDLINSFNAMTLSLENQDNTKNDFIANVSHELRTPITTIGGFADGMLDGTIPEDKRDYYLKIVKDEVMRINKLVNEQLQMARLQQGNFDLKPKSFDINEMMRREIIKNEKTIEDKKIEIEVEFENDKQNVFAEEESINRVIINLLNNAIKFTPEGGKIILGTIKKKETVEIFIRDNGVGIEPKELERIFERYFKSDRSRGIDKTGTGLGLSICKSIINAHNHIIKAENNTDGPGTKFTFWLDAI